MLSSQHVPKSFEVALHFPEIILESISSIFSTGASWPSAWASRGHENETVDLVTGAVRVSNTIVNSPSPCIDISISNDSNSINENCTAIVEL